MDKSISKDLDIIRGIAALGVIVAHCLDEKFYFLLNGAYWVWIFFVVSGFLQGYSFITHRYTLDLKGVTRFYLNRALRILPLFWLGVLIGYAIICHSQFKIVPVSQLIKELFTLTNIYETVGPLWSLSAEIHFYLLVPLLMYVLMRFRSRLTNVLIVCAAGAAFLLSGTTFDNLVQPHSVLGNLLVFSGGILFAIYCQHPDAIKGMMKYGLIAAVTGLAYYMSIKAGIYFMGIGGMLLAVCTVFIIVVFKALPSVMDYVLMPLRYVGKYCYGVYVYAALIGIFNQAYLKLPLGWGLVGLELLSIIVAVISYHMFEKQFLRFKV